MTHLDPELLAHLALHPADTTDTDQEAHLSTCEACQLELAALRGVADLARTAPGHTALPPAPPAVWDRVLEEIHLDQNVREISPAVRRRPALVALAAAIGLIAGVLGGWLVFRDESPAPQVPAATVRLDPLAGKTGSGAAELFRTGGAAELKVTASGLATPRGFYEVWLINTDLKRMISLGVLDPAAGGTFAVPADLVTQGYRIVDVSQEPNDGNPVHSTDSVIRGNLPA